MNFFPTKIEGVYRVETSILADDRGQFIKVFNQDIFLKKKIALNFVESYYSTSKKDVLRGMHFQIPPQDHAKLVYVSAGAIIDVVLDIRQGSPTYGQYIELELSETNRQMVYIPVGCAHGFRSLQDDSCVTYLQTSMYSPEHEGGIRLDSFGYDWKVSQPIISARDQKFPAWSEYHTPFTYIKPSEL